MWVVLRRRCPSGSSKAGVHLGEAASVWGQEGAPTEGGSRQDGGPLRKGLPRTQRCSSPGGRGRGQTGAGGRTQRPRWSHRTRKQAVPVGGG